MSLKELDSTVLTDMHICISSNAQLSGGHLQRALDKVRASEKQKVKTRGGKGFITCSLRPEDWTFFSFIELCWNRRGTRAQSFVPSKNNNRKTALVQSIENQITERIKNVLEEKKWKSMETVALNITAARAAQ